VAAGWSRPPGPACPRRDPVRFDRGATTYILVDLWFRAFLLTFLVEVPIVALMLRRWEPNRPRLLALAFFANLASHPAVWFVVAQLLMVGTPAYLGAAEGWAVACEALFFWAAFRGLPVRRAIVVSLAANAASFVAGLLAAAVWRGLAW
jgi:hypothetical protein